ncbi:uncharacterized protein LOC128954525 [Oppia nitens]|uniref:uncharacterized protein LOC128954525 n=1 Tax=Oppia nitens TaxID=1686743 RepID=UPI0023DC5F49|nr:uncharacterized protein LOC128954525 [Oppia nitens]
MDARQRLNNMRFRSRPKSNQMRSIRRKPMTSRQMMTTTTTTTRVNDLRQLITNRDNTINTTTTAARSGRPNNVQRMRLNGKVVLKTTRRTANVEQQQQRNARRSSGGSGGGQALQQRVTNKIVTLTKTRNNQLIPKVMVDLSQIDVNNSRNRQNTSNLRHNRKDFAKNGTKSTVSPNNQSIIFPELITRPLDATYVLTSPTAVRTAHSSVADESSRTVLVSNLNQSITQRDINDLFGSIGPLVSASKVTSSAALVVYQTLADARNACKTYHNRLLDRQPMHCTILANSGSEFAAVETSHPTTAATYYVGSQELLASQLRHINSLQSPMSGLRGFGGQ